MLFPVLTPSTDGPYGGRFTCAGRARFGCGRARAVAASSAQVFPRRPHHRRGRKAIPCSFRFTSQQTPPTVTESANSHSPSPSGPENTGRSGRPSDADDPAGPPITPEEWRRLREGAVAPEGYFSKTLPVLAGGTARSRLQTGEAGRRARKPASTGRNACAHHVSDGPPQNTTGLPFSSGTASWDSSSPERVHRGLRPGRSNGPFHYSPRHCR